MAPQYLFYREMSGGSAGMSQLTLDAAESVWLNRELEYIDSQVYEQPYVQLQGINLIPSKTDIPTWAQNYTWREVDGVGKAKILNSMGKDFPRSDVVRREATKTIREIGDSYGYTWSEMQAAASQPNMHLDADRAKFARWACELERDRVLAYGDARYGMEGLLTMTGGRTFIPGTKARGGTAWGTIANPNATGQEVYNDLVSFAEDVVTNAKGYISAVDIVLPLSQYAYAGAKNMSSVDNTKALAAALTSPFISSITPWWRCDAATSDGALAQDTMQAYSKNPMHIVALNPMPYTIFPAQQQMLEWVIPAMLKTGGVLNRFPYLTSRAVGI